MTFFMDVISTMLGVGAVVGVCGIIVIIEINKELRERVEKTQKDNEELRERVEDLIE